MTQDIMASTSGVNLLVLKASKEGEGGRPRVASPPPRVSRERVRERESGRERQQESNRREKTHAIFSSPNGVYIVHSRV